MQPQKQQKQLTINILTQLCDFASPYLFTNSPLAKIPLHCKSTHYHSTITPTPTQIRPIFLKKATKSTSKTPQNYHKTAQKNVDFDYCRSTFRGSRIAFLIKRQREAHANMLYIFIPQHSNA